MGTTIQDGDKRERSDEASFNYNSFHRFFLNQQFIMQGVMAVYGNYLIVTVH